MKKDIGNTEWRCFINKSPVFFAIRLGLNAPSKPSRQKQTSSIKVTHTKKMKYTDNKMKHLLLLPFYSFLGSGIMNAEKIQDFEEDSTLGLWGGSSRVTDGVFAGDYSARLRQNSKWGGGYEVTVTDLKPSTTYRFSAVVKTDGGSAVLGVKNHGESNKSVEFDNTDYELIDLEFSTGSNSTSAKVFIWNTPENASLVWADEVSLSSVDSLIDGYELIFSDEFNVDGPIDTSKWVPEVGFKRNFEAQYYRAENLTQSDGNLVITAKREKFKNPIYTQGHSSNWRENRAYSTWTSGSMLTQGKFDFLYGKVVCRAKVTNLLGTWPAIWTVGVADDPHWPANGEIDIMENYKGDILANYATSNAGAGRAEWDSSQTSVESLGENWTDDFHTWELTWTPDSMVITMDGVDLNYANPARKNHRLATNYPGVAPFQTFAQLLWLNLAIGGTGGGDTSGLPDETKYLVDYIRVYQKPDDNKVIDPDDFSSIGVINSGTQSLSFNTDTLTVSGGISGKGEIAEGENNSELAVFVFDSIDLANKPTITGDRRFVLVSKGDLRTAVDIEANGANGAHARHGEGNAGGGDGGDANRSETPNNPLDGQGPGGSPSSTLASGGGGYGGAGGSASGAGGAVYGDKFMSDLLSGSGAGGNKNKGGGAGGGLVALFAKGDIEVTGSSTISVNGGNGPGSNRQVTSGGGSGGGILIQGRRVSIAGGLSAIGGNGGSGNGGQTNGGGGGGGRIAVYAEEFLDTSSADMSVNGGSAVEGNGTGKNGAPGTLYLEVSGVEQ